MSATSRLIPLGAVQRRLAKQAVYLLGIIVGPVRQQRAERKIDPALIDLAGLRVTIGGELAGPERLKPRTIGGGQRSRQHLSIGTGLRGSWVSGQRQGRGCYLT